jgi:hypothetical protein
MEAYKGCASLHASSEHGCAQHMIQLASQSNVSCGPSCSWSCRPCKTCRVLIFSAELDVLAVKLLVQLDGAGIWCHACSLQLAGNASFTNCPAAVAACCVRLQSWPTKGCCTMRSPPSSRSERRCYHTSTWTWPLPCLAQLPSLAAAAAGPSSSQRTSQRCSGMHPALHASALLACTPCVCTVTPVATLGSSRSGCCNCSCSAGNWDQGDVALHVASASHVHAALQ